MRSIVGIGGGSLGARPGIELAAEALGRRPQRQLRVDPQAPCRVDEAEQRLADPPLGFVTRRGPRHPLTRLLAREARRGGSPLHLSGIEQRGQVLGDVRERVLRSPALLLALDPVPVSEHLAGRFRLRLAEHVRVAADQLLRHGLGDVRQVAGAPLLQQQREEVHLEQHVAQLVQQLGVVAARRRVRELVGLLDRVRDDRALVLLPVPRAFAPQTARDLVAPVSYPPGTVSPSPGGTAPGGSVGAPPGPSTEGWLFGAGYCGPWGSAVGAWPGKTVVSPGLTAPLEVTGEAPSVVCAGAM